MHMSLKTGFQMIGVLLVLTVLGGCTKEPAQLFESAKKREVKGDRDGAIIELKAAIQSEPNNPAMRFMLGRLYNETFDNPSAAKELAKAQELGLVEGGRVAVEFARALRAEGKWKELVKEIKPSTVFESEQLAAAHALRGRAQHALGQVDAANESLKLARLASAEHPDAELLDAQIRGFRGDLASALEIVERVLKRSPSHFDALTYKAEILRFQNRGEQVLDAYSEVLKVNPRHMRALIGRYNILLGLGRLDDAQKDLDVLQRHYKANPLVGVLGGAMHLSRNRPREALDAAQRALKAAPTLAPAKLLSGLAYLALRSPLPAEQVLSQYVAENPHEVTGRRSWANALIQLNHVEKALQILEPLLQGTVKDPAAYSLAGDAYRRAGDSTKALDWFEKAAAAAPKNPTYGYKRSLTLAAIGRTEQAVDALDAAVELTQGATPMHESLVLFSLGLGDVARAERAVQALEKRAPDVPLTLNLRGLVHAAKGESQAAVAAYEKALKQDPKFFPAAKNLVQLDLAAKDPARAKSRFEALLKAEKDNLGALMGLVEIAEKFDSPEAVAAALERAANSSPRALDARIRLARLQIQKGDMRRAESLAEDVLAKFPEDPKAITLVADLQEISGSSHTAIQTLSRLVQLQPKSEEAHLRLAEMNARARRLREAETSARRALELRPDYTPAQALFVSVLLSAKREKEALDYARNVQRVYPKSANGFVLEGEILESRGKVPDAIAAYRTALGIQPATEIAIRLFRVKRNSGDSRGATADLQRWLEKYPADRGARATLAAALGDMKEFKLAADHYEQLLKLAPDAYESMNGLAWAYHQLGDPRALATAEAAHKLNPMSPWIADTLGWILLQRGDANRALDMLKKAAAAMPKNPDISYHLAVALLKVGDKPAARKALTDSLASNEKFASVQDAKALLESVK